MNRGCIAEELFTGRGAAGRYFGGWLIILVVTSLLGPEPACAQQALTLSRSIELAQSASPAATSARLIYDESWWSYRAHRAQFLPRLSIIGDAPGLERSVQNIITDDGSVAYVERNSTFASTAVSLSQPIPITGGRVSFSSGISRLNNTLGGSDFTQWSSTPLVIRLNQPILQFNEMKWSRRVEPLRHRVAQRTLIEELEEIAVDVTGRFFDVYIAEMNLDIAASNVAVNDTIFTLSKGRFDIGKIAENDLLQSELALLNAQSEQSQADIALAEALRSLKLALDLPYDADVTIVPPTVLPEFTLDPDEAVARARQNRPAFLGLDLQDVEARRELARVRRNTGFSANLTASYGLNQRSEDFGRVYESPLSQQQLTVNFQIPIVQWGMGKAEVEAAEIRLEQIRNDADLRRKELDQEVYFEALQVRQLRQQVRIAAKADTVAARRFDVAKNRYLIGKIDITELFNAQREKDAARRAYVRAVQQFWTSYYRLRSRTLWDFTSDQPIEAVGR